MKLILLGPPGSGKGTVSAKLAHDFNLRHVSTGALLREEIEKDTQIGRDVKKFVESGDLVPSKFVLELMRLDVAGKDDYILDGFPRSLDQAEAIQDLGITAVIYLEVPEDVVVERFEGRRMDPVTGKGYHLKYIPPPEEVKDRLIQRDDDKPEVVRDRFKKYHEVTQPLVSFYREKGLLKTVDGAPLPDKVYEDVKKVVESL